MMPPGVKQKKDGNCVSKLPDEILSEIISFLPLDEAVRTSIVAKRWVSLWKYVSKLDCGIIRGRAPRSRQQNDWQEVDDEPNDWPWNLDEERKWYVNWMNNICNSHKSCTLDEFKVSLDLADYGYREDIDKWLEFAFSKRVKTLEFDLRYTRNEIGPRRKSYFLLKDTFDGIIARRGLSSIASLTSVSLKFVNVAEDVLESLLSGCPLLERFTVVNSWRLMNFKVTGFRLKELTISACERLQELVIDAANLVSFCYRGREIKVHMQNVPSLVDVCFRFLNIKVGKFAVSKHQNGYFGQLQTLTLSINQERFIISDLPLFSCLQKLNLTIWSRNKTSLLVLTSIINASPSLKKLVLLLSGRCSASEYSGKVEMPHQSLEVVEILGYAGCISDCEIAEYILRNAGALRQMILDTRYQQTTNPFHLCDDEDQRRRREKAWELLPKVPPSIEFVVL